MKKLFNHKFPSWLTYLKWRYVNKTIKHVFLRSIQTGKIYVRYLR